jgi:hypothetical protein
MGPAPPVDCAECGRQIAARRAHYILKDRRVVCGRCLERQRLWDEIESQATRAGAAKTLGLWP